MEEFIEITKSDLEKAFTNWQEEYRKDPSKFQNDEDIASSSPVDYGRYCANYMYPMLKQFTG